MSQHFLKTMCLDWRRWGVKLFFMVEASFLRNTGLQDLVLLDNDWALMEKLEESACGNFDAILICFHLEVLIFLLAKLQDRAGSW